MFDGSLNNGVNSGRLVVGDPRREVGLSRLHIGELDGVAAEEVRDHDEITIVGVFVGEELGVDVDAEDVADQDNRLLGGLVTLGVHDVCLSWNERMLGTARKEGKDAGSLTSVDVLGLADGCALVAEARGTARSRGVRGHFIERRLGV